MSTALIVFIALTVAGLLIHLLCMRILAWRGVTVRRTKFGLTLLFDTADDDGRPCACSTSTGRSRAWPTPPTSCGASLRASTNASQARIVSELPRLSRAAVIGGGGFSFPKWLVVHLPPVAVSVVEIDEKIIDIAGESIRAREARSASTR